MKLPVISEVLGHSSTETTKYYLRVDMQALKQCTLSVPEVDPKFYSQKGGYFMSKTYHSIYAPYIEELIAVKRNMGFKYTYVESVFSDLISSYCRIIMRL